jgi:hypothetical protein
VDVDGDGVYTMYTIPVAMYTSNVLTPIYNCLQANGVLGRIEAFVLMRGIPLIIDYGSNRLNGLAATLQLWLTKATNGSNYYGMLKFSL